MQAPSTFVGDSRVNTERIPDVVWEDHKKEILSLYQNHTIEDVMQEMEVTYNFRATKRQYIHRLGKWGIKKYHKGTEEDTPPPRQGSPSANGDPERVSKRPRGRPRTLATWRKWYHGQPVALQPRPGDVLSLSRAPPRVPNDTHTTPEIIMLETTEPQSRFDDNLLTPNIARPDRLSCPYRKRNALRFNVREHQSCATQPYPDISQLKRHIKIFHKKVHTERCPRCKTGFKTKEEVEYHLLVPSDRICDVKPLPPVDPEDGITDAIEECLNGRKADIKIDSWDSLWRLLFPGDLEPGPSNFQAVKEHHELEKYIVGRIPEVTASVVNNVEVLTPEAIKSRLEDTLKLLMRSFDEMEDGRNEAQHATSQLEEPASPTDQAELGSGSSRVNSFL